MEDIALPIRNHNDAFVNHSLKDTNVIFHGFDFIEFICKQKNIQGDINQDLFSNFAVLDGFLVQLKTCHITSFFIFDCKTSASDSRSHRCRYNRKLTQYRALCEYLVSQNNVCIVTPSDAISTCLAMSSLLGIPVIGSDEKFFFYPSLSNSASPSLREPTFIPITCFNESSMASLNGAIPCILVKIYHPETSPIGTLSGYSRPLLALLLKLANKSASLNNSFTSVVEIVASKKPLCILQAVMQAALNSSDPCLAASSALNYLLSLTPDFQSALHLLTYFPDADQPKIDFQRTIPVKPGSPFTFFRQAMDVLEGKLVPHPCVNPPRSQRLRDLFARGKVGISSTCASLEWWMSPRVQDLLDRDEPSPWTSLVGSLQFRPNPQLSDDLNTLVLTCLLWHVEDAPLHKCSVPPGQCPMILACVFCALLGVMGNVKSHLSIVESYIRQQAGTDVPTSFESCLWAMKELFGVYTDLLSITSQVSGIVLLKPAHLVFPSLRVSALLAAVLKDTQCSDPLNKILSSLLMTIVSAEIPEFSEKFKSVMSFVASARVQCKEALSDATPAPSTTSLLSQPNYDYVSNPLTGCFRRGPVSKRSPSTQPNPEFIDFDRPKTPPPASAFMKKAKGAKAASGYAARLANRYGNAGL